MGAEGLKQKGEKGTHEKRVDWAHRYSKILSTIGFSRQRHLWRWPTMLGLSVCLRPESFGARREEELASGCEGKIDCQGGRGRV